MNFSTKKNHLYTSLQTVGLSENEITLYILMLSSPSISVQELTTKSPFPRTPLYYLLKKLEEKSLIKSKKQRGKTFYTVQNPDNFYQLLERQEAVFESQKSTVKKLIPELKLTYQLKNKKPSVHLYEGIEEFEKALDQTLFSKQKHIFAYLNLKGNTPGIESFERYHRKRILRNIQFDILFFETPESLKNLALTPYNDLTQYRSIQTVPVFESDCILCDDMILYITYSETEPYIVLIENASISMMQKNIFLSIWKKGQDRTLYYTASK